MKKFVLSSMLFLLSLVAFAQGETPGIMTSHAKIYVSITVLAIILTFIFIFLFLLERRLRQLEQKQKS